MPSDTTSSLLRMAGVAKSFGAARALKGVALEVEAGQVLALIGENGAGKSTLMKILSGAVRPDGGQMEFAGPLLHQSGQAGGGRGRLRSCRRG